MGSWTDSNRGGGARRKRLRVAHWGPSSVRGRLVLLTLVLMIPALIVGGIGLRDAAQRERRAVETQLSETTRALALGVDRQIGQDRALLAGLSSSPLLRLGQFRAFDAQARDAAPAGVGIVVRAPDGQQLVNTRLPPDAPLPRTPNDPRTLSWAREDGPVRVSNLFTGRGGQPQIIVQRALTTEHGQAVDIATSRIASSLGAILEAQKLSPSWVGALIDANGRVIARSRNADAFVGKPATPELLARLAVSDEGVLESKTLEGDASIVAYSRAPESRWTVVVGMPREELARAARRALSWAAFIGAALFACGLLLAAWVAEGVVRPIEALAAYAGAVGDDVAPVRPRTRLAEADAVGRALAESTRELKLREEELKRLNATLEARIADRTRELAETTESLIQAQKLEAVGRLTGGIAHDFNNLLTAVQGNLELLARRIDDGRLAAYVANARQAAERGAKLTAQLLAFSRRQRLAPEPVDINASVQAATALLKSTLGGTIRVETQLAPDLPDAMADATQLELIILNLAINARDAMPGGGLISIRTRRVRQARASERAEGPPPGDFVVVDVSDTGTGMTPEVLARVFEPFFTTKEVGRGSGLGLPQVLGVTKQLGGGVEVDTRPGEGTTFTVFLPCADASAAAAAPLDPSVSGEGLRGLRILLVDDDADVRGVAAAMLKEFGCRVREATSGSEALERLAVEGPVDLAVLDYAMPGLNGVETAERLRTLIPRLPVLLMSGYADAATLAETWNGPFLHKPFSAAGLAGQLTRLVGRDPVAAEAG